MKISLWPGIRHMNLKCITRGSTHKMKKKRKKIRKWIIKKNQKTPNFCSVKHIIEQMKIQVTDWKYLQTINHLRTPTKTI